MVLSLTKKCAPEDDTQYRPAFADRQIKLPILWQTWITDAPGGDDRDGGNSRDDADDGDQDATTDDLSSTVILKHPSQIGGQEGNHDTADSNLQSNAHSSSSLHGRPQLVRHQHQYRYIQDATTDTPAGKLYESEKKTTITFLDPMTNPSELEAIIHSARQQPNWKAAVIEGESWEGTAEENIVKYRQVMPPPEAHGPVTRTRS